MEAEPGVRAPCFLESWERYRCSFRYAGLPGAKENAHATRWDDCWVPVRREQDQQITTGPYWRGDQHLILQPVFVIQKGRHPELHNDEGLR